MFRHFKEPLRENADNRALIASVRRLAAELCDEPIKSLSYSSFRLFAETGSRTEYEAEYMEHRRLLEVYTGMALLDPDEKWIDRLSDVIWAISDEYTWALPAHLRGLNTPRDRVLKIDLFASETATGFGEILSFLGDRLPGDVRERMEYELGRRIIDPFLKSTPTFPKNNWSSVFRSF